jgi:hypothetical protein
MRIGIMNHRTDKKTIESRSRDKSDELILARIDAGIDDANNSRFATRKQIEMEFARWRQGKRKTL